MELLNKIINVLDRENSFKNSVKKKKSKLTQEAFNFL